MTSKLWPRTPFSSGVLALVLIASLASEASPHLSPNFPDLFTTSSPKPVQDEPAKQERHLSKELQVTHQGPPAFVFFLAKKPKRPKKKEKELIERWAIVDQEARSAAQYAQLDERIKQAKEEGNKQAEDNYISQKVRLENMYRVRPLLLEGKKDPKQWLAVFSEETTSDRRLNDLVNGFKESLKRDFSNITYIYDDNTTSKRDRKSRREVHTLEFKGTSTNDQGTEVRWCRANIYKMYAGDKTSLAPYRVIVFYSAPFSKRDKESLIESSILMQHNLIFVN